MWSHKMKSGEKEDVSTTEPLGSSVITVCRRKVEYGENVEQRKVSRRPWHSKKPNKMRFQESVEPCEL